jgi:uncharacterized protein YkwD
VAVLIIDQEYSLMRRPRRFFFTLLALTGTAALAGCAVPAALPSSSPAPAVVAGQDPGAEDALVQQINAYRAAHGLGALPVHPVLLNKARFVALTMSNGNCGRDGSGTPQICHSPLDAGVTVPWNYLAENVGMVGPRDVTRMEQAFEASPGHAANMLSTQATSIGVGVAYVGDLMYVAEEFMG